VPLSHIAIRVPTATKVQMRQQLWLHAQHVTRIAITVKMLEQDSVILEIVKLDSLMISVPALRANRVRRVARHAQTPDRGAAIPARMDRDCPTEQATRRRTVYLVRRKTVPYATPITSSVSSVRRDTAMIIPQAYRRVSQ